MFCSVLFFYAIFCMSCLMKYFFLISDFSFSVIILFTIYFIIFSDLYLYLLRFNYNVLFSLMISI